jgi:hypothetical protein
MTIDPWADIPAVKRAEELFAELRARQRVTPAAPSPEAAAANVVTEARSALSRGESLPDDIGQRAADAFLAALVPHYNALAVNLAAQDAPQLLAGARMSFADDALEALDGRLNQIMDEVRAILAHSGRIVDGDAAVDAGPQAVEDYGTLRRLASEVRTIRTTARGVFSSVWDDPRILRDAYTMGCDEITGVRAQGAPDALRDVFAGKAQRGVKYLVALAESGRAWVPSSLDALENERTMVEVGTPAGPVLVLTPTVRINPALPEPVLHGFEHIPNISLEVKDTP